MLFQAKSSPKQQQRFNSPATEAPIAPSSDTEYPWKDHDDSFWTPLSFREFVETRLKIHLYPNQISDLEQITGTDPKITFSQENPLPQQFAGAVGKGGGKGFTTSALICWAVHVFLCLKDPWSYLGQSSGENLDILLVSYNRQQAQNILLHKTKARMRRCTWLKEAIERITGTSFQDYERDNFGMTSVKVPGFTIWALAAGEGLDGYSPILSVLDEVSAWSSPQKMLTAARMHEIVISSARSRFDKRWRAFLISYPRHSECYMSQLIKQYNRGDLADTHLVIRPTWEWNESVTRETFAEDYRKNPERAAMLYECRPSAAIDAYFKQPQLVAKNARGAPLSILKDFLLDEPDEILETIANLGNSPVVDVDSNGDFVSDNRGFPKLARWVRGKRGTAYIAHLDPSLNSDSFGLCIGHLEELEGERYLPVLDLMLRWTPRHFKQMNGRIFRQSWFSDTTDKWDTIATDEIDMAVPREFLFYLKVARGFEFESITFDQWNSAESIQQLCARDFPAFRYSPKKRDFDALKELIYTRRIEYYGHPVFIQECRRLQLVHGDRVECPRASEGQGFAVDSHGDIATCAAAVARQLTIKLGDTLDTVVVELDPPEIMADQKPASLPQQFDASDDYLFESLGIF